MCCMLTLNIQTEVGGTNRNNVPPFHVWRVFKFRGLPLGEVKERRGSGGKHSAFSLLKCLYIPPVCVLRDTNTNRPTPHVGDDKLNQEHSWLGLVWTWLVGRIYDRPTLKPSLEFRRSVCVLGEIPQLTNTPVHKTNTKRRRQKDRHKTQHRVDPGRVHTIEQILSPEQLASSRSSSASLSVCWVDLPPLLS